MPIVTNNDKRNERIETEVNRILIECQQKADNGHNRCYITTDRDIYRDVLDKLDTHNISVIVTIHRYGPSTKAISHFGECTELGLKWY